MKMFVVLALAACVAAEPEADPQFVYTAGVAPLSPALTYTTANHVVSPVVYNSYVNGIVPTVNAVVPKVEVKAVEPAVEAVAEVKSVATPVVYNNIVPTVYSHGVVPAATYAHAPIVAAPVVPSHTVTSYNNANHYTAVSNGAFGPKYIAKNHGVEHVVKREAEADPALLYTSAYGAYPYASVYGAYPYTTYAAAHHVATAPVVAAKSVVAPVTYTHAAHSVVAPVTYAATHGLVKTADHAVAVTPFGATHSSNVGVCTNVAGVQVPC